MTVMAVMVVVMLVIVVVVMEESVSHVESIFGGDRGDHGGNCEGDENASDDNDIFIRDVGREDGGMYQCIAGKKGDLSFYGDQ